MKPVRIYVLGVAAAFAASAMTASSLLSQDSSKATTPVHVADIGESVTLVGRLGVPLGTMTTVVGTWGYPDQSKGATKDYSLLFTASRVNDERLAEPVVFRVSDVEATFRGGETAIPAGRTTGGSTG